MSAENAARCLEHLADPEGNELQDAHGLLTQLTRLEFRGDSLQLCFAGGPDGWMRFASPEQDRDDYDPELLNTLRESGHDLSDAPSLAEVRGQMPGR